MTVRDNVLNEDKATEWPVFQKFRRAAEEAMLRSGLNDTAARMQINELFRVGVVNAYFERVHIPKGSDGQSQAELARKIDIDPSSYSKWMKEGKLPPKSDKFVLVAAATDAKLPRGAEATLRGLCEAFDKVQVQLGQLTARLSVSQALCLWAVFRTQEWWEALLSKDARMFGVATANIRDRMREYSPKTESIAVSEIQSLIDRRLVGWTALELIITHEWI